MRTHAMIHQHRPAAARRRVPVHRPAVVNGKIRRILHGPRIQAKLKVGAPDNAYEREADRVAEMVNRAPIPENRSPVRVAERARRSIQRRTVVEEGAAGCGICWGMPALAGIQAHKEIQLDYILPRLLKLTGQDRSAELPIACRKNPRSKPRPDLVLLRRDNRWLIGSIKPARKRYYIKSKNVFDFYKKCIKKAFPTAKVQPLRIPLLPSRDPRLSLPFPNPQAEGCGTQNFYVNAPNKYGMYGYYCKPGRRKLLANPKCKCKKRKRRKKKRRTRRSAKKHQPSVSSQAKPRSTGLAKGAGKQGLRKVGKKLIPGHVFLELGMVATALLAGAKPTFGAGGVSVEEALVDLALHGTPPNVKISEDLQELLAQNPALNERLRKLAAGKSSSDEAVQQIFDLMERNKDLLDAEALEGLVDMMEQGGAVSERQPTAKRFRKIISAAKSGVNLGPKKEEPTTRAPEPKAKSGELKPEKRVQIDPALRKELAKRPAVRELFLAALGGSGPKVSNENVRRLLAATRQLSDSDVVKILAEVRRLPKAAADGSEGKKAINALTLIERLAKKTSPAPVTPSSATASQGSSRPDARQIETILRVMRKFRKEIASSKEVLRILEVRRATSGKAVAFFKQIEVGDLGSGVYVRTRDGIMGSIVTAKVIERVSETQFRFSVTSSTSLVDSQGTHLPQQALPIGVTVIVKARR